MIDINPENAWIHLRAFKTSLIAGKSYQDNQQPYNGSTTIEKVILSRVGLSNSK